MSSESPRIVIITHSADAFRSGSHLVHLMLPIWRAMGLRVEIVSERTPFVEGDLAILHVNLSVIPEVCRRLVQRYPRVINGHVLDICQRSFSRLLLSAPARTATAMPHSGPVIVKTNLNYRGEPEFRHRLRQMPLLRRFADDRRLTNCLLGLEARRPWHRTRVLREYPVYEDISLVPAGVWKNHNLVVERFVAERANDEYICRHWLFLGDQELGRITRSADPMVKLNARVQPLREPVPEELRRLRAQLGFDYGKFDYGIVSGELVVYDVNKTPGRSRDPRRHSDTVAVLSRGLGVFLPSAEPGGHAAIRSR